MNGNERIQCGLFGNCLCMHDFVKVYPTSAESIPVKLFVQIRTKPSDKKKHPKENRMNGREKSKRKREKNRKRKNKLNGTLGGKYSITERMKA